MNRHRLVALAALATAIVYIFVALLAGGAAATDLGVVYLVGLVTLAVAWEWTRNGRQSR